MVVLSSLSSISQPKQSSYKPDEMATGDVTHVHTHTKHAFLQQKILLLTSAADRTQTYSDRLPTLRCSTPMPSLFGQT